MRFYVLLVALCPVFSDVAQVLRQLKTRHAGHVVQGRQALDQPGEEIRGGGFNRQLLQHNHINNNTISTESTYFA
jgi:hypothetical protein